MLSPVSPCKANTNLSNSEAGQTVIAPLKWYCNTGEVPIRIKLFQFYNFLWLYINVHINGNSEFGGKLTYLTKCVWIFISAWFLQTFNPKLDNKVQPCRLFSRFCTQTVRTFENTQKISADELFAIFLDNTVGYFYYS